MKASLAKPLMLSCSLIWKSIYQFYKHKVVWVILWIERYKNGVHDGTWINLFLFVWYFAFRNFHFPSRMIFQSKRSEHFVIFLLLYYDTEIFQREVKIFDILADWKIFPMNSFQTLQKNKTTFPSNLARNYTLNIEVK